MAARARFATAPATVCTAPQVQPELLPVADGLALDALMGSADSNGGGAAAGPSAVVSIAVLQLRQQKPASGRPASSGDGQAEAPAAGGAQALRADARGDVEGELRAAAWQMLWNRGAGRLDARRAAVPLIPT